MSILIDNLQTFAHDYLPTTLTWGASKMARGIHIVAVEAFAVCWHVVPAAVSWWIKRHITHELTMYSFEVVKNKVHTQAYLYLHGSLKVQEGVHYTPLLLAHGDHSHPYTMLHLAQLAQKKLKAPVFSLQLPWIHDDERFEANAQLIEQSLDKIQALVQESGGIFEGVIGAGHSKGAIMLAEREFAVDSSLRIKKTCAIAGPLNAIEGDKNYPTPLGSILRRLFHSIHSHPERALMQIIPDDDWNVPYSSMAVRPDKHCYTVPGMHLSGLYAEGTSTLFDQFCEQGI